ncbi:ABC transporter permease [Sulfurospirillum sp. T05]|uniref:ABC transporter permease n=1 Tax=Sulfurospirillum tamanense TaxID=2813362 RepID=A0ABS2WTU7_9BACT|nr:FtsX-like permease family protein [Sulfurospirillum tamanensis]MBN2965073.1 ABC transporter permease [Sulfurospirillum tamanensis]
MNNILKISFRNLKRNSRRTLLTASLITLGVVFVLLYTALSGSFKGYMIGQITDSNMGHIQIHKKGYVASVDTLPLDKNLNQTAIDFIEKELKDNPYVESYAFKIKFGAMFSNFESTTNIRLNAIIPEQEFKTLPALEQRITGLKGELSGGEVLVPELLANGMKTKIGDTIVLVANNKAGSVNGINVKVGGIVGQISGPGGKDGYITLEDAKKVLRMGEMMEVSEIVIRLKDLSTLEKAKVSLAPILEKQNKEGKPSFEVHTWEQLSPFYNIIRMLDVMNLSMKIILISIVLISILNVMVMSVYERVREIGTIAAMGTRPSTIVKLFLAEGLMLGIFGAIVGGVVSFGLVAVLNVVKITYSFGRESGLVLSPSLGMSEAVSVGIIVIFISLVASISPALKASRLDPVEALRTF